MLLKLKYVWDHVHAYLAGLVVFAAVYAYYTVERAYIAPVPEEHLVWLWGLSCVVFLHHAYQSRYRVSLLMLVDHGFIARIRDGAVFARMVHNHRRAIVFCDVTWLGSFVFSAFYYMLPTAWTFPVWLGMSATTILLLNRANRMFDLAQGVHQPVKTETY